MAMLALPPSLLRSVSKPARYTGGEWNSVSKVLPADPRQLTRFAFCFPDTYEIGMSNLALRIFYSLLNERADTWCERFFAPWKDMEAKMRQAGLPLFSLESRTPLAEFDFVGFTIQYELAFTNVLNMLDLGGVPLLSCERGETQPLVIAGGPAAFNLEPMADFFDMILIGEGEEMIVELLNLYRGYKTAGRPDKLSFLLQAAQIEGVYVPGFYEAAYHPDGTIASVRPSRPGIPPVICKRIIRDLDDLHWPARDLVPNTEIVHDRVYLEIFRGCTRGCRFCQAGMIYRPVREKAADRLASEARQAVAASGYDEVGLLSLSTSDYSGLEQLTSQLLSDFEPLRTSLSLPSLRLDSFSLELMQKAARTRKGGLTFAPEAGTQRLRDVINKNITEDDLLQAMRLAFQGGWSGAKLYFMLGLPTETLADVTGIADLTLSIVNLYNQLPPREKPRKLELTISTAIFIPKPFTPFQWAGQSDLATLQERQQHLRGLLRHRSIKYQWHDLPSSRLEAVLARGDRRLAGVILDAWQKGRTFDAWDESFDWDTWQASFAQAGLDPDFYASRERPAGEVFPWEHIDCGVSRAFLLAEYRKAQTGDTTPECRILCSQCGAGDFAAGICCGSQAVPPGQKFKENPPADREFAISETSQSELVKNDAEGLQPVLRLRFARTEPAVWLAHLDMMRVFERTIRRAGLPVAYSHGFNPRPQMTFALPIGTSLATQDDYVDLFLTQEISPAEAVNQLNCFLPAGITVLAAASVPDSGNSLMSQIGAAEYLLETQGLAAAADRLYATPAGQPWLVEKTGKSGPAKQDIRPLILGLSGDGPDRLIITVLAGSRQNLRPDLFLSALVLYGGLDPQLAADASITRLRLLVPTGKNQDPTDRAYWQSPLPLSDEN
jgi:radical SAM family uncharacterized protein/radical SAM-linked protein